MIIREKARHLLEHPLEYPDLTTREGAMVRLQTWIFPAFEPEVSWSVIEHKNILYVRRVVWNHRTEQLIEPETYGAEVELPPETFTEITEELCRIVVPPFATAAKTGIDGVCYGISYESHSVNCRLEWWNTPPTSWHGVVKWFENTRKTFQSRLPGQTIPSGT